MNEHSKLAAILREALRQRIAADEAEWLRTPPGQPAYAVSACDGEDPIKADIETTEGWLSIAEHGLPEQLHPEVAFGLAQVRMGMLQARLRRLQGDGPDMLATSSPASGGPIPPERKTEPVAPIATAAEQITLAEHSDQLLSEVLPETLDRLAAREEWRGQTLA